MKVYHIGKYESPDGPLYAVNVYNDGELSYGTEIMSFERLIGNLEGLGLDYKLSVVNGMPSKLLSHVNTPVLPLEESELEKITKTIGFIKIVGAAEQIPSKTN